VTTTPGTLPTSQPIPVWAESTHPLGWVIERILAVKPLKDLLFQQARQLIIRTAESRGIAWRERREELRRLAEPLLESSTDPDTQIPFYYRAPFHAYHQGNLCWEAACEAEQATSAMALRVWPNEQLTPAEAEERLRAEIFAAIEPSLPRTVERALDVGCSVGVSTQVLKQWLDQRQGSDVAVEGLDLSPHMLAVARVRDPDARIARWHHAAAEDTGLPAGSFDLVSLQFLCHELPGEATRAVLREAHRLLRPGGVLGVADQDPGSEVIQRLPAPLAGVFKSTEPYLEAYYRLDLPAAIRDAGFRDLRQQPCDPRHRVLVAVA
jgi:ubiquinone/menaquinone biosynthesis C-methylase UbiE